MTKAEFRKQRSSLALFRHLLFVVIHDRFTSRHAVHCVPAGCLILILHVPFAGDPIFVALTRN